MRIFRREIVFQEFGKDMIKDSVYEMSQLILPDYFSNPDCRQIGYIHFRKEKGVIETTGHSGGFFQPPEYSPSSEKLRSDSITKVQSLSGNKGSRHSGSTGEAGFDGQRDGVINNVINEALRSSDLRFRRFVAARAHIEALKFVVNNTVSYRDNNESNRGKFKGLTTDGLNLADPISREYALKHYQAVRDAMKLVIVELESRLSGENIPNSESRASKLERIKRRLSVTVLDPKYHFANYARSLSPLRYASPYSRANIDITLDKLGDITTLEDVTSIYSTPIPTIKLSERLASSEERRPKTEPRKKKADLSQNFAATFPLKAEKRSEVLQSEPLKKEAAFTFSDLHDVMNPQDVEESTIRMGKLSLQDINATQVSRVKNYASFYADDEIDLMMNAQLPRSVAYITPAISAVPQEFNQALVNFIQNPLQNQAVIVVAEQNHFTGIHVARNSQGEVTIGYFDPMVDRDWRRPMHDLPPYIIASLNEKFSGVMITAADTVIQTSSSEIVDNNHCGAFVTHFMTEIARGNLRINADLDGRIQERIDGIWRDIPDLNRAESNQLGEIIRDYHARSLASAEMRYEENPVKISQILDNNLQARNNLEEWISGILQTPPRRFDAKYYNILSRQLEESAIELTPEKKEELSRAVVMGIRIKGDGDLLRDSAKFFTRLSKLDLLDYNYSEKECSLLCRAIYYAYHDGAPYRDLANSISKRCNQAAFDFVGQNNETALILAVRQGWFEESRKISEMIPAKLIAAKYQTTSENNDKTALTFIAESKIFTREQKDELLEILTKHVSEIPNPNPALRGEVRTLKGGKDGIDIQV